MHFLKKKKMRFLAGFLILGLLTGCGGTEKQEPIWKQALFSAPDRQETRKEYRLAHQFTLPEDSEAAILETCVATARVLSKEGCQVTFYSRENGEEAGAASLSGDYAVCNIRAGRQNEAVVFLQPSSRPEIREVWLADGEGNCRSLGSIDFSDLPAAPFGPQVKDVQILEDGTVFLWYSVYILARDSGLERHQDVPEEALYQSNRIYVLDGAGGLRGFASEPERIVFGKNTAEGYELLCYGENRWFQETVDAAGEISEQTKAEEARWLDGAEPALCGALGDTLYYIKDNALWKYAGKAEEVSRVFELSSFGMVQEEARGLRVYEDGRLGILAQRNGETSYLCLEEGESEVTVLTLACVEIGTKMLLSRAATEFNRTHQDCRVEIVDYLGESHDYEDAFTRLLLDFTRGSAPDLLVTSSIKGGFAYSKKGMLCNLYEFMEGDAEVNRETVVPSILKAYEEDGGLYVLAPGFVLSTVYGPKSLLGDQTGLSMQEYQKLLDQYPDKCLHAFSNEESALMTLLQGNMDEFIDWETGTCNFDSREFQGLLEFIKEDLIPREYVLDSSQVGNAQLFQDFRNGKILLEAGGLRDVYDYSMMREIFGEEVTLIGYPTGSGSGTWIRLTPDEVSITSASQNKDKAWEFLKFYCMFEDPEPAQMEPFSILQARLEEQFEECQTAQYIINEIGEKEKVPRKHQSDTYHTIEYSVYESSKEDVEAVAELIKNADRKSGIYSGIFGIILEEVPAYFEGDKKASEVSKVIQGRMRVYLAE